MSLIAKANINGSITVSCGTEALNISVVGGQLVVSASAPILSRTEVQPVRRWPTPPPEPVIIPGPPATGPRTMFHLPGLDEDLSELTIGVGKPVCFAMKRDEWVDATDLWDRLSTVATPKSLHFYFPTKRKL